MRRIFSFLFALALTVGGTSWLAFQVLAANRIFGILVMAAALMIVLGVHWLWVDFIDATPNQEG